MISVGCFCASLARYINPATVAPPDGINNSFIPAGAFLSQLISLITIESPCADAIVPTMKDQKSKSICLFFFMPFVCFLKMIISEDQFSVYSFFKVIFCMDIADQFLGGFS